MKKKTISIAILTFAFIMCTRVASNASDQSWKVFDDTAVGEVQILIDPASLDYILNFENSKSDSLFRATFIFRNAVIPDDTLDNIGFRLRGNTSRGSQKKSFKIDINHFVAGRQFYDLEKLNLNGEHNDPSIVRSKLCWDLFNSQGIPASRANYVKLFINNEYRGLYLNVEHIDDEFIQKRFGNQDGNLYKCLYPADLDFLGSNPEFYKKYQENRRVYDLKTNRSEDDYSDLAQFIDVLNNTPQSLFKQEFEKIFNVHTFIKWLAVNVIVGSWDDYWYLKNNYYLYHNTATDKFEFIPYDYDNTYGVDWVGGDWGKRDVYNWGNSREKRPLVTKILNVPEYRAAYTRHIYHLIQNEFSFARQERGIDQLRAMITPAAEADTFRSLDWDFSIADFHQSFVAPVATERNHVPYGIKPYILTRISNATMQLDALNSPKLYINEFMASNAKIIADEKGEYEDWVEIYNGDTKACNLAGMFLTDNFTQPAKWMLPDVEIQPGGFLLIWADGDTSQGKFHANFKLSASGEQLGLYSSLAEGNFPIDMLSFSEQQTDISYGRFLDGTSQWQFFGKPTPGKSNQDSFNSLPVITNVSRNPTIPAASEIVRVRANVTDNSGLRAVALKYFSDPNTIYSTLMYDDGNHQDGAANDDVFGGSIIPFADKTIVHYFIQAQDDSLALRFDPAGAPDSSYSYQVGYQPPLLFINEFMADNLTTTTDEAGEFDDWIEIYNSSNQSINLAGKFLTDDYSNPTKWLFPDTSISAHGFLLVWADENRSQGRMHANFKLSKSGERLGLFEKLLLGNAAIDTVTFGLQKSDTTLGRYPDARNNWTVMLPTPAASNKAGTKVIANPMNSPEKFKLLQNYPNPFNPETMINFEIPKSCHIVIKIFNTVGQEVKTLVTEKRSAGYHQVSWDGKDNSGKKAGTGIYIYQLQAEDFVAARKMVMFQ